MKMRIVSDGTALGTKVFGEDGEMIRSVRRVEWSVEVGGLGTAVLHVDNVEVDIVGETAEPGPEMPKPL